MSGTGEKSNIVGRFSGWVRRSKEPGRPDQLIIEGPQATHPWVRQGVQDTGGVTVEGEKPGSGAISILPIEPSPQKSKETTPPKSE